MPLRPALRVSTWQQEEAARLKAALKGLERQLRALEEAIKSERASTQGQLCVQVPEVHARREQTRALDPQAETHVGLNSIGTPAFALCMSLYVAARHSTVRFRFASRFLSSTYTKVVLRG